jgi:nitrate/nitrite-specific signal transduction histidine kinase
VADLDAGDTEQARNLFSESGNETYQVQMDLDYLILLTERARADTLQEFPSDISFAIWVITIGLVVILLLGLWGYTAVSGVTQPLLVLTNAIIAIGGDQYRPELVADLKKRRNRARKLAQALDRLAQTLQNRDAALKQEVDDLRQQLFESRRKRLKISRPNA